MFENLPTRSKVENTFDSVNLINDLIKNGDPYLTTEELKNRVRRNVEHLKIVLEGNYIDLKQFSKSQLKELQKAIDAGNAYVSSL